MPVIAVSIFENPPQPDPDWISEARERLALILGLEGLTVTVTVTVTMIITLNTS